MGRQQEDPKTGLIVTSWVTVTTCLMNTPCSRPRTAVAHADAVGGMQTPAHTPKSALKSDSPTKSRCRSKRHFTCCDPTLPLVPMYWKRHAPQEHVKHASPLPPYFRSLFFRSRARQRIRLCMMHSSPHYAVIPTADCTVDDKG